MSLDWLYTLDELAPYRVNTKKGQERLDAQIKNLPSLFATAGVKPQMKSRILCLMAGSCIEGIAIAKIYNSDVTCLDLQSRLLSIGLKEAKKRRLNIHTITGDIREVTKLVTGKFDLVTILGTPLPHIGIFDFDEAVTGVRKILAKNGTFLIEQSDLIFRILPNYREAMTANTDPPVFYIHRGFNPRDGYFERILYGRTKHEINRTYLWAPWIIEYMLKKNGFTEVEVKPYVDPYSTMQTYLHTAKN